MWTLNYDSDSMYSCFTHWQRSFPNKKHPEYYTTKETTQDILNCYVVKLFSKQLDLRTTPGVGRSSSRQLLIKRAPTGIERGDAAKKISKEVLMSLKEASDECDHVYHNNLNFLFFAILLGEFDKSIKSSDFARLMKIGTHLVLFLTSAGHYHLANKLLRLKHGWDYSWSEEFKKVVEELSIVNPSGAEGYSKAIDLHGEQINVSSLFALPKV